MADLPDAAHLLTLLAVAEAGNESSAAELLGVGQSSISRRLAALQEHTPTPLTQRTAAGTRLTPAGAALLPHAREVREALRSAGRLLGPAGGIPSRVNLGVSPHLLPRLAGPLAGAEQRAEPLELQLTEGPSSELLAAVRGGRLDAALTLWAPAGTEPGLSALQLGSDRTVLVAPAGGDAIRGGQVNVGALRGSRLLLPGRSSVSDHARALARALGIGEARLTELSGPAAVRAAVLAGEGVGVSLASYVAAEVAAGWLAAAPTGAALDGAANAVGNAASDRASYAAGATATNAAGATTRDSLTDKASQIASDSVGVWLLTNDALPEEAARRLVELARESVEGTALR